MTAALRRSALAAALTTSELSLHRCPAVKARGVATSIIPAVPAMDLEGRWEEYNRRQREIRQQAKERGLCTRCYREPVQPNKALCGAVLRKEATIRSCQKQKLDRARMPESKPAVDVPRGPSAFVQERLFI